MREAEGMEEAAEDSGSESNSSIASGMSELNRRAEKRDSALYDSFVGMNVTNALDQLKIGDYILCQIGKSNRIVLDITECELSEGVVVGFYCEEVLPRKEDGQKRFKKHDERKPTEVSVNDVICRLEKPMVEQVGRRRRFIFKEFVNQDDDAAE